MPRHRVFFLPRGQQRGHVRICKVEATSAVDCKIKVVYGDTSLETTPVLVKCKLLYLITKVLFSGRLKITDAL
jgi:hypothetical protein